MTAFRATYSDWRLIRSRRVVQIVLEVPLEEADGAYKVLGGMPEPASERWFGIAPLDMAKVTKLPDRSKRMAQQAGICCNDPVFWKFLCDYGMPAADEATAATAVRLICGVRSRSELMHDTPSGKKWDELYSKFLAWREAPDAA